MQRHFHLAAISTTLSVFPWGMSPLVQREEYKMYGTLAVFAFLGPQVCTLSCSRSVTYGRNEDRLSLNDPRRPRSARPTSAKLPPMAASPATPERNHAHHGASPSECTPILQCFASFLRSLRVAAALLFFSFCEISRSCIIVSFIAIIETGS